MLVVYCTQAIPSAVAVRSQSKQICARCTCENDADVLQCCACDALFPRAVQCHVCATIASAERTRCINCEAPLCPMDDPEGKQRVQRLMLTMQQVEPHEVVECEDELSCQICSEDMRGLVLLRNCGHAICRICLEKCIETRGYIHPQCPFCRREPTHCIVCM